MGIDDLIRFAENSTYGDFGSFAASDSPKEKRISYDYEIPPCNAGAVRHACNTLGIGIIESDIDELVRCSQVDPVVYKFVFDTILRANKALSNFFERTFEDTSNQWQEEYYINSIESRIIETDGDMYDFLVDTGLSTDVEDKGKTFSDFWLSSYDAIFTITVQLRRKTVYADTQPDIYFSTCYLMRRRELKKKSFLSVNIVAA